MCKSSVLSRPSPPTEFAQAEAAEVDSSTAMDTSEPAKVRFWPPGRGSRPIPVPSPSGRKTGTQPVPSSPPLFPQEEDDYDVMQDPEFLQSVLENLPGVDPNNEAIRNAMGSLASQASKESKDKKEEEKK